LDKNSKIYVAGHTGLVGSAILRRLQAEGYTNLITRSHKELDLTRQGEVDSFFEEERPEYVFLAAAKVGGILANNTYPAEFIYTNLTIQTNAIHASWRTNVKKLLFLGSSCIYPRECPQPMKEEYLLTGKLEPTNEPYAIAKIAGIRMCQAYNRQYRTCFISVMPTNLYGPGDNLDLETSHVLPALIRKFHEAKVRMLEDGGGRLPRKSACGISAGLREANETEKTSSEAERNAPPTSNDFSVTVWGTGTPRREFLHVDDLSDACLFLMNKYDGTEMINIGVGKDISIGELSHMIAEIVGYEGEIRFDPSKPDGTPRKLLDVTRLHALGWKSRIPLREGIRMTYEWYLGNLD
jgi:GDP-L-fucose synthase